MRHLFNKLFGNIGDKANKPLQSRPLRQPRAIIQEAIENVVDGTEPRIRLIRGYQKKLQEAVNTSLTYIEELVEAIPAPFKASRKTFVNDPHVNAYFASIDELHRIFSQSQEIKAFFDNVENSQLNEVYALLCMDMSEKSVMGVEVNGDMLRRDVLQTAVNFSEHKIMATAVSEVDIRQGVKKCIFEGLITYALQGISSIKTQKNDLQDQRRILHSRLRSRLSQGTGLNTLLASAHVDHDEVSRIEAQLADTEKQLSEMPVNRNAPLGYLNEVNNILAHPETFIKLKMVSLKLSKMSIIVYEDNLEACNTIHYAEIYIANVLKRVIAIVRYPRDEMSY